MDWSILIRELIVGIVAALLAIWGNNFVQKYLRKEIYREKLFDKIYEIYSDLSEILHDLNKSIIEITRINAKDIYNEDENKKWFYKISEVKNKLFEFHIKKLMIFSDKAVQDKVQEILKLVSLTQIKDMDVHFGEKIWLLYEDLINTIRDHLGIEKLSNIEEMKSIYK